MRCRRAERRKLLVRAWELAGQRGLVVLPTGAGNTHVAIAAMARTALTTLCLVPTRVLLQQWLRAIQTAYPHPVGRLGDGTNDVAPVTVATFESAYRCMDRLGNRFDLLIVDAALVFPDFALQHRLDRTQRWLLEIVGFWTPECVARKLALYRAAGLANFILCIDDRRQCADGAIPAGTRVVRFRRRVDASAVLRLVERDAPLPFLPP